MRHQIFMMSLGDRRGMPEAVVPPVSVPSRTEALKALAGAGLVTMSPYKGAVARTVDDDLARSVHATDCGNDLIVGILDRLRDRTALVSAAAWIRTPSREQEAAEHRAILDAAASGDADGAAGLLRNHIDDFVRRYFAGGITFHG